MFKKVFVLIIISVFCIINISIAQAAPPVGKCDPNNDTCETSHGKGWFCEPDPVDPINLGPYCQKNPFRGNFGKIQPPDPIKKFVTNNPTGAIGISQFLSNLVTLFYTVAAVVLIFMLLWGAFEWMTSGGDKEKIESARRRIISAIIGMILFAVAFAVIQILGNFTGFKFFVGQK